MRTLLVCKTGESRIQRRGGTLRNTTDAPSFFFFSHNSQANWCFFESQTWQGSDYIRYDPTMCWNGVDNPAICNETDFQIGQITPEMEAMTSLYNSTFVCLVDQPSLNNNNNHHSIAASASWSSTE